MRKGMMARLEAGTLPYYVANTLDRILLAKCHLSRFRDRSDDIVLAMGDPNQLSTQENLGEVMMRAEAGYYANPTDDAAMRQREE